MRRRCASPSRRTSVQSPGSPMRLPTRLAHLSPGLSTYAASNKNDINSGVILPPEQIIPTTPITRSPCDAGTSQGSSSVAAGLDGLAPSVPWKGCARGREDSCMNSRGLALSRAHRPARRPGHLGSLRRTSSPATASQTHTEGDQGRIDGPAGRHHRPGTEQIRRDAETPNAPLPAVRCGHEYPHHAGEYAHQPRREHGQQEQQPRRLDPWPNAIIM